VSSAWINSWARHYQRPWQERAGNPRLPLWLRVAALTYGSHKANGHANYRPGEVAVALATVDAATGEIRQPTRQDVNRAVKIAIGHGWLAPASGSTCLVVPGHMVAGGLGNAAEPCPVHEKKSRPRRHRDSRAA
jgi:stage V sporulation protein SpoVS